MLADLGRLPTPAQLQTRVEAMTRLGPRLPGTGAHDDFVDQLAAELDGIGLTVHRYTHRFTRWAASEVGLDVIRPESETATAIPVAAYYPNSGSTPPEGTEAQLTYLGTLHPPDLAGTLVELRDDVGALARLGAGIADSVTQLVTGTPEPLAGRIAVVDVSVAPLTLAAFWDLATHVEDPDGTLSAGGDYTRTWSTFLTLPTLDAFREAGAAGVVLIVDASPADTAGQYTPFRTGYQGIPAIHLDGVAGGAVRAAARDGHRARLTLSATRTPSIASTSVAAVLPGGRRRDDVIVVHTHTDGQNAFEENGAVALVELARYFATATPEHTFVFSLVTGHFASGLPETEGFLDAHQELTHRAVAGVSLEHLGAAEWSDERPTGQPEPALIFHSNAAMAAVGRDALLATDLRRTMLCAPIGPLFFGVGLGLHLAGIPTLAYLAGPDCLLAIDGTNGHLERFDAERMHHEVVWAADVLHRLDHGHRP